MASDVVEAELLSDDQIELLIQEAETRLRAKNEVVPVDDAEEVLTLRDDKPKATNRKRIPRLEHGIDTKRYIRDNHGVAIVNPELLANKQQQALADQLRLIEKKDKSKKEVRTITISEVPFYEETYPISLTQTSSPFRAVLQP